MAVWPLTSSLSVERDFTLANKEGGGEGGCQSYVVGAKLFRQNVASGHNVSVDFTHFIFKMDEEITLFFTFLSFKRRGIHINITHIHVFKKCVNPTTPPGPPPHFNIFKVLLKDKVPTPSPPN